MSINTSWIDVALATADRNISELSFRFVGVKAIIETGIIEAE